MKYILKRSLRKTISVEIRANSEVIVRAPKRVSQKFIDHFVHTNMNWIEKKIISIQNRPFYQHSFKPENGHSIYFLGSVYPIKKVNSDNYLIKLTDQHLEISGHKESDLSSKLNKFFKNKAKQYLTNRINEISKEVKLPFKKLRITSAKTRWGSCSHENNINLSFRLIMLPDWVIDYVIIHELVHTKIKNHSPKFWAKVSEYNPNTQKAKQWIKEHRYKLPF